MGLFTPLGFLLAPFASLYRAAIQARNKAYDWSVFQTHQLPPNVKVVSVGNISVGGTGKTPMAEYLLNRLLERGARPAYLSRGYGRGTKGYLRVLPDRHDSLAVGDEALQVALKFPKVPVAVCEDRVAGARQLLAETEFDVLILDDAFQHRRIARDLDIVMIDATRPPWHDHLLPWGRLREPVANLSRADVVVVNKLPQRRLIYQFRSKVERPACFSQLAPTRLVSCNGQPNLSLEQVKLRTCVVFSGLGNNAAFLDELKRLQFNIVKHYGFPDHHRYTASDLQCVSANYRKLQKRADIFVDPPIVVTTEKDYVRLKGQDWFALQFAHCPVYYLEVRLNMIEGEDLMEKQLDPLFAQYAGYHSAAI